MGLFTGIMVRIIHSFFELNMDKLSSVYDLDGPACFDDYNELVDYLRDDFFRITGAFYAVLEAGGQYVSALRAEPYLDGFLIEALETAKGCRNNGFATKLLRDSIDVAIPAGVPVYAHIHKQNRASLSVHKNCGFHKYLDYASFVDGSVSTNSCTLVLRR